MNDEQRERAGLILEAIQEYSTELVRLAYYEKSLEGKFSRDSESSEMIDIIFDNRYYDICSYYGWGGIPEVLMKDGNSNDENLKSNFDSLKNTEESEFENSSLYQTNYESFWRTEKRGAPIPKASIKRSMSWWKHIKKLTIDPFP